MIDWEKQFPVACINRADLTEFGLTDEQIALATDDLMEQIAEKMRGAYYLKQPFWDDLRKAVEDILVEKKEAK